MGAFLFLVETDYTAGDKETITTYDNQEAPAKIEEISTNDTGDTITQEYAPDAQGNI